MTRSARAGFSLAEALVVLAITAVLLVLLLQVSTGATRSGFRLAARADAAGERVVGAEALRILLRGVRLPERDGAASPFRGDADGFSAAGIPGRPTPCGDGAPAAVSLRLERAGDRVRVLCAAAAGRAATLLDLGAGPAAFSYALAGRSWSDRLAVELPPSRPGAAAPTTRVRLWIRLTAAAGEWVEAVDAPTAAPRPAGVAPATGAGA